MHIKAVHVKTFKNLKNLTLSFDREYEYYWYDPEIKDSAGKSVFQEPQNLDNTYVQLNSQDEMADIHWWRKPREIPVPENFYGKNIENIIGIVGENGSGKSSILELVNTIKTGYFPRIYLYPYVKTKLKGSSFEIYKFNINNLNNTVLDHNSEYMNMRENRSSYFQRTENEEYLKASDSLRSEILAKLKLGKINALGFSLGSSFAYQGDTSIYWDKTKKVYETVNKLKNGDLYTWEYRIYHELIDYFYNEIWGVINKEKQGEFRNKLLDLDEINKLEALVNKYCHEGFSIILKEMMEIQFVGSSEHQINLEEFNKLSGFTQGFILDKFVNFFVGESGAKFNPSSGEKAFLFLLNNFKLILNPSDIESAMAEYVNIISDEPDTFLHPEWQRLFIELLVLIVKLYCSSNETMKYSYNIIFTTHSPIMLSDLHQSSVIKLQKIKKTDPIDGFGEDGIRREMGEIRASNPKESTFGANIFQLYKDSFFLDSMVGEFAQGKIDECIDAINQYNEGINNKNNTKYQFHGEEYTRDDIRKKILKFIGMIGDRHIRQLLINELNDNNTKIDFYKEEIKRLENKKKNDKSV